MDGTLDAHGRGAAASDLAPHGNINLSGDTKINGYALVEGSASLARNVNFNFDCSSLASPTPARSR